MAVTAPPILSQVDEFEDLIEKASRRTHRMPGSD
jgi:hypothetical protein